jgi:hypothetical protein
MGRTWKGTAVACFKDVTLQYGIFLEKLIVIHLARKFLALWNQNVHYRLHKNSQLDNPLGRLNPGHPYTS